MKKILKNLFFICLIVLVASCSNSSDNGGTKTITDQSGEKVVLPNEINNVVIIGPWPIASIYALYMGSGEKVVGVSPGIQSAGKYSLLNKIAPEIGEAETGFIKSSGLNIEEMLALKPDVVFYSVSDTETKEKLDKTDVASVGFDVTSADYNTIETVNSWVSLLSEIFGEDDKAKGITEYGHEIEKLVSDRLKDVDKKDYPTALMLFDYSTETINVAGNNFFSGYWCETARLNCVASEIDGYKEVNMEQIIKWNPEMVFVTNFSSYLAEDFYNGNTGSDDWSTIKAIKNKDVYKFPLGMYRWFPPSSESPLTLLWLAKTAHPKEFEDIDLNEKIKEYYKKFFNVELTDEEVKQIFNPPREAANAS